MDSLIQLATDVGGILKQKEKLLACAESCTGGLISATVTRVPGSSEWFDSGYVCYSNLAKARLLGINRATIEYYGPVSREIACLMAQRVVSNNDVDVGLAVTGIAGPGGGTPELDVGTVWFAWHLENGKTRSKVEHISGSRIEVQQRAVILALEGLIDILS
ncbi:MAG: CinA family protein [Proteobacteria bacterium]|nr:CinA family protein [Pseudomonadota bacterium]MDE3207738.1 CinA family protein [Pseudomonadota bacterium]